MASKVIPGVAFQPAAKKMEENAKKLLGRRPEFLHPYSTAKNLVPWLNVDPRVKKCRPWHGSRISGEQASPVHNPTVSVTNPLPIAGFQP